MVCKIPRAVMQPHGFERNLRRAGGKANGPSQASKYLPHIFATDREVLGPTFDRWTQGRGMYLLARAPAHYSTTAVQLYSSVTRSGGTAPDPGPTVVAPGPGPRAYLW